MLLEAKDLSKIYRSGRSKSDKYALKSVSLQAEAGKFIAIVGESGSGKSTLVRLLLDLIKPSSGSISFQGRPLSSLSRVEKFEYRQAVQAVLQDPAGSLNPRKRIERVLLEITRLHNPTLTRTEARRRSVEALEQVGMVPGEAFLKRFPHELSGGQRQRVLIARVLCVKPQLIIADEAVSALDISVKAEVLKIMQNLQNEFGIGYVFVTHDLPVVKKVADYVYVMKDGEVVERNTKQNIFNNPQEEYTRELLEADPLTQVFI